MQPPPSRCFYSRWASKPGPHEQDVLVCGGGSGCARGLHVRIRKQLSNFNLSNGKIKENSDECGFWCELDIWLKPFFQRWPLKDQKVAKQLGLERNPKVFCCECPKVLFPWPGYFFDDNPPAFYTLAFSKYKTHGIFIQTMLVTYFPKFIFYILSQWVLLAWPLMFFLDLD